MRQTLSSLEENGIEVAELMMLNFSESGHPIFRATSALERGILKSEGGGKLSIHFRGDCDNVEQIFSLYCFCQSSSVSTEQSQICVKEFVAPLGSKGRLGAVDKSESTVTSDDLLNIQRPLLTNEQEQGDLLQNHKERVENLPNEEQLIKLCTDAGFLKNGCTRTIFI